MLVAETGLSRPVVVVATTLEGGAALTTNEALATRLLVLVPALAILPSSTSSSWPSREVASCRGVALGAGQPLVLDSESRNVRKFTEVGMSLPR